MTMYPQQSYQPPPAKRRNPKWLVVTFLIIMFGCVGGGIAACIIAISSDENASPPGGGNATTPVATAAASAPADPYAVYLANNPDPSLVLSREDAQARAFLGCGQTWAPGTIDAALADAYRPMGLCGR